ncbi:unnamed protein product, partial [Prorocentrum cordatum]
FFEDAMESDDLKQYVDDTKKELLQAISAISTNVGSLGKLVNDSVGGLSRQVEARMSGLERTQREQEDEMARMSARITRLEEILGIMQKEVPQAVVDPSSNEFDRQPDPAILVIRCKSYSTKESVAVSVVKPIIEKNNIPHSEVQFEGDPAGKRFVLRIKGSPAYAARRVGQIIGSFKISAQEWRRFSAMDSQNTPSEVFVSVDKSQAQVKREIVAKQLKRVLSELYPQHHFHIDKAKGEVSLQWKPLLRGVPAQGNEVPTIEYADVNLQHFNLSRTDIEAEVAQALFHHKQKIKDRKIRYAKSLLGPGTILGIQESRGSEAEIKDMLFHMHRPFQAFFSLFPVSAHPAGGVITILPYFNKTHGAAMRPVVTPIELVRGRAVNVRVLFPNGVWISHFNIHNHGLTSAQSNYILETINMDYSKASEDPLNGFILVGGDFNFSDEPPKALDDLSLSKLGIALSQDPENIPSHDPDKHSSQPIRSGGPWKATLKKLVEIDPGDPTHFCAARGTLGKQDRLFVSAPGWCITQMCTGARVHWYPEVLAKTKLSDHAAISVILAPRSQTPPKDRRIHRDIFKRREYQQFIESVLAQAVWNQDMVLARRIVLSHPFGRKFLSLDVMQQSVSIADPIRFHAEANEANLAMLHSAQADARQRLQGDPPTLERAKLAKRTKSLQIRARLWSPFDRKLPLQGLRTAQDTVASKPNEILSGLAQHWGSVFAKSKIDKPAAFQCAQRFKPSIDLSGLPPPSEASIVRFLDRVSPSAPGPDGLPYWAWKCHPEGPKVLCSTLGWDLAGNPPLFGFNQMLGAFLVEGSEPE